MKTKSKILLTSMMSIAFASSLIAGSTYALFTSKSEVNIAVTSGKVKVDAKVNKASLALTSMEEEQEGTTWANGGVACFTDQDELKLDYITPGDKATFTIDVTNESNVNIKYKVDYKVEGDLADALEVTFDSLDDTWTNWLITEEQEKTINVSVELPESVGNEYQDSTATIAFVVEAVQGNAACVSTLKDFKAALAEGGNFALSGDIELADEVISIDKDTTINLNGHNLDASKNSSRPFELADDVNLTINGGNETIEMGAYGLININESVQNTTITLNGGNYVGKTNNGCMIKPRGYGEITVNLNDVTVMDSSDNESWVINPSNYYGSDIVINVTGGSYSCYNGFKNYGSLALNDVTMNIKHVAVYNVDESLSVTVDGCNITVTNEGSANANSNYPNACVAASGNGTIVVKNSTLTNESANGNATAIYTSGGNIVLENCQVIGRHVQYHGSGEYPNATFSTTVDGETPEIVYPNCPNGCSRYNH